MELIASQELRDELERLQALMAGATSGELHHDDPFGRGGDRSADNIRRLSRLLTTLLLLRAGYEYVLYSSLESVIEGNKDAYYVGLRQTQGTIRTHAPDWQPWLSFFLESLQQQEARLEKKMERELLILGDLPELSVQILELCRERGRVTVAVAAKVTGANRNTIKDHLKALTKAGHIVQHGAGRGAWYGLA